jgi:hypothetical protein
MTSTNDNGGAFPRRGRQGARRPPLARLDARYRWSQRGRQHLVASVEPAGSRGYRDLLRDAEPMTLGQATVQVASLGDVIRLAGSQPAEHEGAFTPPFGRRSTRSASPSGRAASQQRTTRSRRASFLVPGLGPPIPSAPTVRTGPKSSPCAEPACHGRPQRWLHLGETEWSSTQECGVQTQTRSFFSLDGVSSIWLGSRIDNSFKVVRRP